jgi:hypothetical protein
VDAHVPQCQGVVRVSRIHSWRGWPVWLLAIVWMLLLAYLPWWLDLPLLLSLAATQAAQLPRLQRYGAIIRLALRWGLAGLLLTSYRALQEHALTLSLTLTLLAALVGFSLLVLLESWQDRRPLRNAAVAAASPEWGELALTPTGPPAVVIELQPPRWVQLDGPGDDKPAGVTWLEGYGCRIGEHIRIDHVEPRLSEAPGQRWVALPTTSGRGVVLYDRVNGRPYRLRGWLLYGWHGGEPWLSRGEDQPPLALSHVLGQDQLEE